MEPQRLIPGDSTLVENIVNYLKAKGIFDEFRHECLADVDTKSSCQNLSQRVDGYASKFLANETWHPDLNKNELRNKLRRHIDESGMLAVGADHVVEQVINPKIHHLFLPKIVEVVHQYMKEQNEMLSKKPETSPADSMLSENVSDTLDMNKTQTSISDPIADILSFSYSKTKSTPVSNTHGKTDNTVQKHTDLLKVDKKKEDKSSTVLEKNILESPESHSNPVVTDIKPQTDKEKEKTKKDEPEVPLEIPKKEVKEEIKQDKKKVEEAKPQSTELYTPSEENKPSTSLPVKPNISSKKDVDKNKQKSKSVSTHKSSSISSDVKKLKKESSDKLSEKHVKSKLPKPLKESPSPTKGISSVKSVSKDEKGGEISKSKSSDSNSSKTSESSQKKSSKSNSYKTDCGISKHKGHNEKSEKYKILKSSDKSEQNLNHESANHEKIMKNILYSSSYDSSQGSDQEKSSSSSSKKERQKYFSKHTKKESSDKSSDKSSKVSSYKKRSKDAESPLKKHKREKNAAHEKFKETITVGEAAKISSRSNSFGSTSSVSSSSNTSKDNLVSNSDEASESSKKDKNKKQINEKEPCHSKTLPPPPPPPPPSSSLSCELTSSAEVSSIEDTQSSSNSENSSSEELSEQSSSDSEVESKESVLNTLNENLLNSSTEDINDFYDIFLYSSSSSEFEGYGNSPDKKRTESVLEKVNESDISVSSVHTSDLSSYDDELSDDDLFFGDESHPGAKKTLTLKEAQELIQKRKAILQSFDENKNAPVTNKPEEDVMTIFKRTAERSSSLLSSEDESFSSEPKRSLRRERKLNPRYASSEYTSIFNSRKETFITKQSNPYTKNQTPNCSPMSETKYKKESMVEKDKSLKKNSVETRIVKIHQGNIERSNKTKRKVYTAENLEKDKELSDSSEMSSSDEMDSIIDKEKLFSENDESNNVSVSDQLKLQFKFKPQSISNYTMNSYPVKRKLKDAESSLAKRPCSRGSVDSSSSECVPNENKPFNSEKHNLLEEKAIRDGDFKVSDLTDAIKKDLFCKQRTNNNGDILGQKDIFPKHSHGRALSTPERKTSETENSKELSAL